MMKATLFKRFKKPLILAFGFIFLLQSQLLQAAGIDHCTTVEETVTAPWGETIHYLVFLPKGYSNQKSYSTQYFLHGKGGDRYLLTSFGMCELLDKMVDEGKTPYVIIAPDGGNSYWVNGAWTGKNYADFIAYDLIKDAEKKYSLIHDPRARELAGISMGGTGAIQLELNYPGVWAYVASHSPIVRTYQEAIQDFKYEFGSLSDFQKRDPFSLIKLFHKRFAAKLYMDTGREDFGFWNASNLANLLKQIGTDGEFHMGEDAIGAHDPRYWDYHFHHDYVQRTCSVLLKPIPK